MKITNFLSKVFDGIELKSGELCIDLSKGMLLALAGAFALDKDIDTADTLFMLGCAAALVVAGLAFIKRHYSKEE